MLGKGWTGLGRNRWISACLRVSYLGAEPVGFAAAAGRVPAPRHRPAAAERRGRGGRREGGRERWREGGGHHGGNKGSTVS